MERERVREEHAERQRRAEAEQAAQREEERLRREAEARRARAELLRQHEERRRADEERARIEAMQHAVVERARVEAEWRGRAELEAQHRAHETRLAALRGSMQGHRLRWALLGSAAVAAAGAVAVVVFAGRLQNAERVAEVERATLALERESRDHTSRLLDLAERRARTMESELETVRARAAATVTNDVARSAPPAVRPARSAAPVRPAAPPRPCKNTGDPLDDCLPVGR